MNSRSAPIAGPKMQAPNKRPARTPPTSTRCPATALDANVGIGVLLYPTRRRGGSAEGLPPRDSTHGGHPPFCGFGDEPRFMPSDHVRPAGPAGQPNRYTATPALRCLAP